MTGALAESFDHFGPEGGHGDGLYENLKKTDFFTGKLQITNKEAANDKGVPSTLLSVAHNTLNGVASPLVDTANNVSSRVFQVLKTFGVAAPILGHPIQTVKENGFWKGTGKVAGTAVVGGIGGLANITAGIASAPAKVYERIVNDNVQDLTGLLHLTSDKLRSAEKFGLKTVAPGILDGIANGTKVLSKTGGYLSGIYLLNWMSRKLDKGVDIAQDFVKLENIDTEKSRAVKNGDPTILQA